MQQQQQGGEEAPILTMASRPPLAASASPLSQRQSSSQQQQQQQLDDVMRFLHDPEASPLSSSSNPALAETPPMLAATPPPSLAMHRPPPIVVPSPLLPRPPTTTTFHQSTPNATTTQQQQQQQVDMPSPLPRLPSSSQGSPLQHHEMVEVVPVPDASGATPKTAKSVSSSSVTYHPPSSASRPADVGGVVVGEGNAQSSAGAVEVGRPQSSRAEDDGDEPINAPVDPNVQRSVSQSAEEAAATSTSNNINKKVLTQEEQDQLDRLAMYDEMGDLQALALIRNSQKAVPQMVSRTVGATLHQVERVTDFVVDHIPQPVSRMANFAGDNVVLLAATTATVLEKGPDVLINAIPEALMSKATKKLVFVDFNNTLRSFFHTNILAIPYVFNETGLVTGLLLTTFVAACSLYATETFFAAKNMLADASRVMVYGDVPRMTFGDWYPSLNIFYGVIHLVSFLAFAAHNMQVVLAAMGVTSNTYLWGIIIPSVISVPLIFMKNAKHQRPLGILSNFLVMLSVVLMLTVFPFNAPSNEIQMSTTGSRLIIALGVVIYAFTGIGSAVPVERTMDPMLYRKLCRIAVIVSFLLLVAFGLAGYLSYGQRTCAVITLSLGPGKTTTAVAVLLMIASIAIIPQQIFPFAEVMDRRLLGLRKVPEYWDRQPNFARLCAMIGCAFIAYAIPWYGLIVSLCGAVGCGILGLIIPAALDYSRRKKIAQRERRRVEWTEYIVITAMIVFGVFTLVMGVLFSLYDMWQKLQASSRPGSGMCSFK